MPVCGKLVFQELTFKFYTWVVIFLFASSANVWFKFISMMTAHTSYSLSAHTTSVPKYTEEQAKISAG